MTRSLVMFVPFMQVANFAYKKQFIRLLIENTI